MNPLMNQLNYNRYPYQARLNTGLNVPFYGLKNSDSFTRGVYNNNCENNHYSQPFRITSAIGNFIKGVFSPVSFMFSSMKNFLLGSGMIFLGTRLCKLKCAPILSTIGAALGILQGAKGLYQLATAKNGREAEQSFYNIGASAVSVGLASYDAKAALRNTGLANTENLTNIESLKECFRQFPSNINETLNSTHQMYQSSKFKASLGSIIASIKGFLTH